MLFFIDGLRLGGKERRILELLSEFSKIDQISSITVVSTLDVIAYPEFKNLKIDYIVLKKVSNYDPRIFYKFYKICKKVGPDVVHCWSILNTFFAIPAKSILKFSLVNSQITNSPDRINWLSIMGILSKINFHYSDHIIANSYSGLKAYLPPSSKSKVIYNSFSFNRLSTLVPKNIIRSRFDIRTKYVVAMVAAINFKKDYRTYIRAAINVLNANKDITFLCVGEGNSTEFDSMIDSDFRQNIKFIGKQNNVEGIMNICDIGILNTYTEGISNTILEFMALGKPVVVSGEGGCNEIVENERNGYLIEPQNYELVAKRILELISNPELRNKFGNNSRNIVAAKFNVQNMFSEYSKIYGI